MGHLQRRAAGNAIEVMERPRERRDRLGLALEADTHSDILSAPTLLTADNMEVSIVVGRKSAIRGIGGVEGRAAGADFRQHRQNVGMTLDIAPQVSDGDYHKAVSTTVIVQNHRTAEPADLPDASRRANQDRPALPRVLCTSVAVSHAADLKTQNNNGVNGSAGAMPEGDKPTPFSIEEIPAPASSAPTSIAPRAAASTTAAAGSP
jgi:Bacterial type II and III secretion system protein